MKRILGLLLVFSVGASDCLGCLAEISALIQKQPISAEPSEIAGWKVQLVTFPAAVQPWDKLIMASRNKWVIVWDYRNPSLIMNQFEHPSDVVDMFVLQKTLFVITATQDSVFVWSFYENPGRNLMKEYSRSDLLGWRSRFDRKLKRLKIASIRAGSNQNIIVTWENAQKSDIPIL